MSQQHKDREEFEEWCEREGCSIARTENYPDYYVSFPTQSKWYGWQAARDHYAPKMTETEAVEKARFAIAEIAHYDESANIYILDGIKGSIDGLADAATAAIRTAGVRFKV